MIWRCDLQKQYQKYKTEIDQAVLTVLNSGKYTFGENVLSFEKEFSSYIGSSHGIGVGNGTDALILSLKAIGVQSGDEVITTAFTAIPTYSAIRAVGAIPIFVDIDRNTFLMDIDQINTKITSKTKAIIAVHLFGNVIDIDLIRKNLKQQIPIIEDCAQSHGAVIRGQKAGSLGDVSAFSFYPTKNLGGYGDGGLICTNNDQIAEQLRLLSSYGMVSKDSFVQDGVNSRLDEVQAAILRIKLKHLDEMNQQRVVLAKAYQAQLPLDLIGFQKTTNNAESVYHIFNIVCQSNRDGLAKHLEDQGIQVNMYYLKGLHQQEGYIKEFGSHEVLENTEWLTKRILALPFYPEMDAKIVDVVSQLIHSFVKGEVSVS